MLSPRAQERFSTPAKIEKAAELLYEIVEAEVQVTYKNNDLFRTTDPSH
jgi:hypothetical protein